MKKRDSQEQYGFFYDEDGTNEVSQQIMNSYNIGTVGEVDQDNEQANQQTDF